MRGLRRVFWLFPVVVFFVMLWAWGLRNHPAEKLGVVARFPVIIIDVSVVDDHVNVETASTNSRFFYALIRHSQENAVFEGKPALNATEACLWANYNLSAVGQIVSHWERPIAVINRQIFSIIDVAKHYRHIFVNVGRFRGLGIRFLSVVERKPEQEKYVRSYARYNSWSFPIIMYRELRVHVKGVEGHKHRLAGNELDEKQCVIGCGKALGSLSGDLSIGSTGLHLAQLSVDSAPLKEGGNERESSNYRKNPRRYYQPSSYFYQRCFLGFFVIGLGAALLRLSMELLYKADEAPRLYPAGVVILIMAIAFITHGGFYLFVGVWGLPGLYVL